MMILIIRFSCPPTIHLKFITKCDRTDVLSLSPLVNKQLIDFKVSEERAVKVSVPGLKTRARTFKGKVLMI